MKAQKIVGSVTKEKKYSMREEMSNGERWREEGGSQKKGRERNQNFLQKELSGIIKRSALCCAL